jgi:hypothetical protein
MATHAVCARIQISHPHSTQYPSGKVVTPTWSGEQLEWFNKIAKQSPLFERQVLRLLQDSEYVWKIQLKETDEFYDDDLDLGTFIPNLGCLQGRNSTTGMEVKRLSRRCSALWHFEVLPSKVHLASYITDGDGKTIASTSPTPTTSSAATVASAGGSASRAATALENIGSERVPWCWDDNGDRQSLETSLKLANIALVLGLKDVFRREIKTVIWNWPKETTADKNPSVKCLRKDGTPGVKGLNGELQQKLDTGWSSN